MLCRETLAENVVISLCNCVLVTAPGALTSHHLGNGVAVGGQFVVRVYIAACECE